MCMAGGRAPHIPHSLAMEGGARRRRRRAVVVGPSCHQGSVGPSVSISRLGEHLSQGDNLTPEGTFEALNSTFVPREEYM